MAGLHSSDSDRRPARKRQERPEAEAEAAPRRLRTIEMPDAGAIVEVVIEETVVLPATVARVQDDLIWIRLPPVIPCGHSFHFTWAARDGARESVAAAVLHTGDGGLMARMEMTQRADRRAYDRIAPTRCVLVRAMLFDVAGAESVGTIFGQVADASFGGACFRTAGAPTIGQALLLWFRDDDHTQLGEPVPAKVVSVTVETRSSRLVCVSFGRVGLAAQTIREVLMGAPVQAAAA